MTDEAPTGKTGIASLILGGISLVAWMVPVVGAPISAMGMLAGIKGISSPRKAMAMGGVVLSFVGFMFAVGCLYVRMKV